jgi:hypothetical protein
VGQSFLDFYTIQRKTDYRLNTISITTKHHSSLFMAAAREKCCDCQWLATVGLGGELLHNFKHTPENDTHPFAYLYVETASSEIFAFGRVSDLQTYLDIEARTLAAKFAASPNAAEKDRYSGNAMLCVAEHLEYLNFEHDGTGECTCMFVNGGRPPTWRQASLEIIDSEETFDVIMQFNPASSAIELTDYPDLPADKVTLVGPTGLVLPVASQKALLCLLPLLMPPNVARLCPWVVAHDV